MKKISYYFMLVVAMLYSSVMLTACTDDDDASATLPELSVNFVTAGSTSAQFAVDAKNIAECAYLVKESTESGVPSNEVIFAKGIHFNVVGADTITVPDLKPNSSLVLYVAAKANNDNLLDKVESVPFSTTDFSETVTVFDRKYDGFSVHVKVPKDIQEKKNALRFTRGVLPFYNLLKMQGVTDAEMLLSNGGDERSTTDATTYTFDEANSIIEDEETGEVYEIDSPIVPGEPSVFLAGEFSLGESPYGWGEGYYNACFDTDKWFEDQFGDGGMLLSMEGDSVYAKEDSYWQGYHHRELVYSKQPNLLDGGIKVDTIKLVANNAKLRFTPDENVASYCVLVADDAVYSDQLMPMFNYDEKYLQWFTTSYMAFSQLGAQSFSGVTEFNLEEFFEEGFIGPDLKCHILITCLGDENGTSQSFQHLEIVTPQRTLPAPELEVKGIKDPMGGNNPYEVWFNIKSVGDVKLEKGKYVANYERDTEAMFNNGYDAASLVENSGVPFTEEEIEAINSEEGLPVRFDSRANACTYLIAVGYNEEGLNSEAIIGKNRSADLPAEERFESPLFKGLTGEWTASATMSRKNYETGKWEADSVPTLFKVNIGNEMACPESLPENVYDLYGDMSKEKVDALYDEFKTLSKDYTKRLENQNCLLCSGFNIEGKADGKLEFKTPYELFIEETYKGYNNEALFYDFGPKWFLHITKDGKVSLPINTDYLAPMSNWKTDRGYRQAFFLVGLGEKAYVGTPSSSDAAWSSFPVEVSKNMDTITIHPIVVTDEEGKTDSYYPSPVAMRYGQAMPATNCKTVSAITLTKGWNEAAATAKVGRSIFEGKSQEFASVNGKSIAPKVRPMGRTPFVKSQQKINRVKITRHITAEEFNAGMNKLAKQWLNGQKKHK